MFLALGVSEAIASANTVFVDNSTNPPSLSIEGNEENDGLGLIVTQWGSWTNITAKSDNKVADVTGLNFYSESQDNTLEVLGNTKIHLVGIAEDNINAGNVEGIFFLKIRIIRLFRQNLIMSRYMPKARIRNFHAQKVCIWVACIPQIRGKMNLFQSTRL